VTRLGDERMTLSESLLGHVDLLRERIDGRIGQ